jgi:hypothetical protein
MHSQTLQLSRLRDIGWSLWDPIRLLAAGEAWDNQPFANEYDHYLLEAAGRLRCGWSIEDATDYLMRIERDHMGLGTNASSRSRAETTAKAIRAFLAVQDAPKG